MQIKTSLPVTVRPDALKYGRQTLEMQQVSELDLESRSPVFVDFVRDFDALLYLHRELEAMRRSSLGEHLHKVGAEVRGGSGFWTKADVNGIMQWRNLQSLRRRIEQSSVDLEKRLNSALMEPDIDYRINALCRIPGVGPVLACAVLTLTWPETYGCLDNPSWHALRLLGFDLPPKPYSGGGFSVAEALHYQDIIRAITRITNALPSQVADALHAFDKARNGKGNFVA
jgi:hypothetical protein